MHKCSSTILYAAWTFRPYKSRPVLKLFRTFTGKMTRGLSLQMVFSLLFLETLFTSLTFRVFTYSLYYPANRLKIFCLINNGVLPVIIFKPEK